MTYTFICQFKHNFHIKTEKTFYVILLKLLALRFSHEARVCLMNNGFTCYRKRFTLTISNSNIKRSNKTDFYTNI